VLDLIPPGRPVSIEREVFPQLVGKGLRAVRDDGYFNDIGTPASYLRANHDVLDGTARTTIGGDAELVTVAAEASVDPAARLLAPCVIGPGATVGPRASVGPYAVVGAGARVAQGARVVRGVVHEHADVGVDASVEEAVVGTRARVAEGVAVTDRIVAPDELVAADEPTG
jgi:mannose-1-phosphate guanylyltransferase